MDKELERMHDLSRALLKQLFKEELAKKGTPDFSDSRLKKIRKTMTQLDQNYKMYADGMESALSTGGSASKQGDVLRSAIRGVEEEALEAMKLLEDDSVHHIIGSRTGGDTLIEAPGDRVRRVMARLEDEFEMTFSNSMGPGGNLRADMSLSNRAHKWDQRARGLELESGVGKEPTKATVAHRSSTAGHAKNLTPEQLASDDALYEALRANFQKQIDDANIGQSTDAPRQKLVRELIGDDLAYSQNATPADVARARNALSGTADADIIDTYRKGFSPQIKNGRLRLGKVAKNIPIAGGLAMGGLVLATGGTPAQAFDALVETENPIENLDAGPVFDESQDYGEAIRQAKQRNSLPLDVRLKNGALGLFKRSVDTINAKLDLSTTQLSGAMK